MAQDAKIIRLEEQMKAIKEEVVQVRQELTDTRAELAKGFEKVENKLDCYVRRDTYSKDRKLITHRLQFMEKIVYGAIGLALTAVVSAVLSLVLNK